MSEMDSAAPPQEVELKLAIASPSARDVADREVGRAQPRSVETIYYDTPGRRLHSAGYSLRLRRDGEAWSQSVKAANGVSRFEQDFQLRGAMPDFSLLQGTPIAAMVDTSLAPVFVTRVQRRSRRRDTSGGRIEFSLDEGEVIAHDRSWPIHELELELKAGEPEALFDEGRRLAEDNAFVPDFMSKAERGFALADGMLGEPVKFGARPLAAGTTASAAFQTLARRCLRQLSLNAELIAGAGRLEAVHQARTALRRLRVAMNSFKDLLDHGRLEALKGELKWLTGELADARNIDVLLVETFEPRANEFIDRAAATAFGKVLLHAQERAHERARAALASSRFRLLLLDAARWVEGDVRPNLGPRQADPPIEAFAAKALERRRRTLKKRLEVLDWDDPYERHKVRIAAKKMRYEAEFFLDLGPKSRADSYKPFVKTLAKLQDGLGGLNDLTVAEPMVPELLTRAAAPDAERVAYAAGLIVGRDLACARKLTKSAKRASKAFLGTPTWW
ncbi:MAG: CHAD domain-containing protein [Caulobacteraceae bacterium]